MGQILEDSEYVDLTERDLLWIERFGVAECVMRMVASRRMEGHVVGKAEHAAIFYTVNGAAKTLKIIL